MKLRVSLGGGGETIIKRNKEREREREREKEREGEERERAEGGRKQWFEVECITQVSRLSQHS